MKDLFALKKLSPALALSLQSIRIMLSVTEPDLSDDTFRSLVLDRPDLLLERVRSLSSEAISEREHERICGVMDDADYDAAAAARESESGLFLDVHAALIDLRENLHAEHEDNRRLSTSTSFVVAVDGSRQSYLAFEAAVRLRRHGKLVIVNVDDSQSSSLQLPQISPEFIRDEYKAHCVRLGLPPKRFSVETLQRRPIEFSCYAAQLIDATERSRSDFLVVGSVGKGGPAINQLGHVSREVATSTLSVPILVIPPAPVNLATSKRSMFVVAIDKSAQGRRCLNAALKLMQPVDQLRVVHFYRPPVVGEYDSSDIEYYRSCIDSLKLDGQVDLEPMDEDASIAESLQDYIANQSAAVLVLGLHGEGRAGSEAANGDSTLDEDDRAPQDQGHSHGKVVEAMLFSPRCALCVCP